MLATKFCFVLFLRFYLFVCLEGERERAHMSKGKEQRKREKENLKQMPC